jgi:hypothetical protein
MKRQFFPIFLTIITFFVLVFLLYLSLSILNFFPLKSKVILVLHPVDILIGLTIYIKTAIDFALFIGALMHRHPGVKNRIAIELGTSIGNGLGTLAILTVWIFFKEVPLLLILMMVAAALVLLRMAEDSVQEYQMSNIQYPMTNFFVPKILSILHAFNKLFDPVFSKLLPHPNANEQKQLSFWSLFLFALSIPFILGLDDFAGYIPLFSIVNVFGFATGVFLGHTLLTASLFAFPKKTTQVVKLPAILLFGGFVFLGLSVWGFVEAAQMLIHFFEL